MIMYVPPSNSVSLYPNKFQYDAAKILRQPFNINGKPNDGCILMRLGQDVNLETESPTRTAPVSSTPSTFPTTEQEQTIEKTLRDFNMTTPYGHGGFPHNTTGSYVNGENNKNNGEAGLSPDTSSNRPTPTSSTPSDSRSNLQPRSATSRPNSHETSPSAPHNTLLPNGDGRPIPAGYYSTGMTPDAQQYVMQTGSPNWEMNSQTTGLTPVGEGVFRQLMGLGPMDPMFVLSC